MTPTLLKWFAKYQVCGRKLRFRGDGTIDHDELEFFERHLRADWGHKRIPAGVTAELERESIGKCPVSTCGRLTNPDRAHVERWSHETPHYFQHPHNLIHLCPSCHTDYDSMTHDVLTHEFVKNLKHGLLDRLMDSVRRDVRTADDLEVHIQSFRTAIVAQREVFWVGRDGIVLIRRLRKVVMDEVGLLPAGPVGAGLRPLVDALAARYPLASAKLAALSTGSGTDDEAWEHLDAGPPDPGYCIRGCGECAPVSSATCPNCDHENSDLIGEAPRMMLEQGDRLLPIFFEDNDETPECEVCAASPLDYTFEGLCDNCRQSAG
jgi:hypothetical protein